MKLTCTVSRLANGNCALFDTETNELVPFGPS
jgi:hypothetical protein